MEKPTYIDSHIHLYEFSESERNVYLERLKAAMVASYSPYDLKQLELPSKVFTAIGLHPWYIAKNQNLQTSWEYLLQSHHKHFAIGETGLDFYGKWSSSRALQIEYFKKHIDLAVKENKNLILHAVHAEDVILSLLPAHKGIVHSFQGSFEQAKRFIEKGFYISLGPSLLKSSRLQEVASKLSMDFLLLESDAPGQKSNLDTIFDVYEMASRQLNLSEEKLCQIIQRNFDRLIKS